MTLLYWSPNKAYGSLALQNANAIAVTGGSVAVTMGTGTGTANVGGLYSIVTNNVANVGSGEDDLMSITIPANSLSNAGKTVRITAWGSAANTADSKVIKAYAGATNILSNGAMALNLAQVWFIEIIFTSTGTDTQKYLSSFERPTSAAGDIALREASTTALDDGSTITFKFTGTATADNDLIQTGMMLEFLN